jgi:hypothetical protein
MRPAEAAMSELIEEVPEEFQEQFERIQTAANQMMYSVQMHDKLFANVKDGNFALNAAGIAAAVVGILHQQSQGFPMEIAQEVTEAIALNVLDFMDRIGAEVTDKDVQTTLVALDKLMGGEKYGTA